ncbi:MAG: hypothetical protein ABWX61_07555 [Paenisporosarcina sp.]
MGRDNHNSSSNNKNSLPQTPKTQKIAPKTTTSTTRKEEFSREFTEIINKTLKQIGTGERNNKK